MTDKRIKLGFVGAGRMAREHARAFRNIGDVALVGIASRTAERAQQAARDFSIGGVYGSVDELVSETKPDVLVVAVPEHFTVAVMRECVGRVPVILVEKPVGLDLVDCRAVRDLSGSAATKVFVGLNRRCYGATRSALQALSGDGGCRFIEVHDQEDIAAARAAGRHEDVIRNWMFANSIHMIDFFCIFGRGDVVEIDIVKPWAGNAPAHVVVALKFSSGDEGLYHAVWNIPGPWACSVTTQSRRVEMRPVEHARLQLNGSRELSDLPEDPWDRDFKPGFRRQADEIASLVRDGITPQHVPHIAEALVTTELVARLYSPSGRAQKTLSHTVQPSFSAGHQ